MDELKKGIHQIKTQGSWVGEIGHIRKDGTPFPTYMSVTLLKDGHGKPTGILAVCRDITEHEQAEEDLRDSEERYRELFENESDALVVFDAETFQFEDANPATLSLYGYSKEEFLTVIVEDVSAEKEKTRIAVQRVKNREPDSEGVPLRYFRKKDGTIFPGEISAGTFMSGGRKKIIGAVRDITERKWAEEALRESEERYRMLFENANDAIFIADTKTNIILDANRQAEQLIGRPRQEIIGMHQTALHPPQQAEYYKDKFLKAPFL